MIVAAGLLVTGMGSLVLVILELRKAPQGYEDERGFHAVRKGCDGVQCLCPEDFSKRVPESSMALAHLSGCLVIKNDSERDPVKRAVGFIDWLDYQPGDLSNVPILIHSKCKNIHTLSACAGVHENLVPLSAPQAQRSPTFF